MSDERKTFDHHTFTSAEAAAAGEDDTWQNEQIVSPDDMNRLEDDPEGSDEEEELT
jgi:hypothetical protein